MHFPNTPFVNDLRFRYNEIQARTSPATPTLRPDPGVTTHIALLRGINVGGNRLVAMADLRNLLTALGFADARSLLQSGNLVFRSDGRTNTRLAGLLEVETEKQLGLRTDFFVRTATEWDRIVLRNPFPDEAKRDPAHLVLMLLKDAPSAKSVQALQSAIVGAERVRADGTHAYITYPDGTGRSRVTNALIDGKLGTRGTGRNWNTVLKVQALASVAPGR